MKRRGCRVNEVVHHISKFLSLVVINVTCYAAQPNADQINGLYALLTLQSLCYAPSKQPVAYLPKSEKKIKREAQRAENLRNLQQHKAAEALAIPKEVVIKHIEALKTQPEEFNRQIQRFKHLNVSPEKIVQQVIQAEDRDGSLHEQYQFFKAHLVNVPVESAVPMVVQGASLPPQDQPSQKQASTSTVVQEQSPEKTPSLLSQAVNGVGRYLNQFNPINSVKAVNLSMTGDDEPDLSVVSEEKNIEVANPVISPKTQPAVQLISLQQQPCVSEHEPVIHPKASEGLLISIKNFVDKNPCFSKAAGFVIVAWIIYGYLKYKWRSQEEQPSIYFDLPELDDPAINVEILTANLNQLIKEKQENNSLLYRIYNLVKRYPTSSMVLATIILLGAGYVSDHGLQSET